MALHRYVIIADLPDGFDIYSSVNHLAQVLQDDGATRVAVDYRGQVEGED